MPTKDELIYPRRYSDEIAEWYGVNLALKKITKGPLQMVIFNIRINFLHTNKNLYEAISKKKKSVSWKS